MLKFWLYGLWMMVVKVEVDGVVIDVSSFTTHEQFLIQKVLNKKFHLKTSLHYYNKKKNYVKLYFKKKTVHVFKKLIKPYVIPSLQYKLGRGGYKFDL